MSRHFLQPSRLALALAAALPAFALAAPGATSPYRTDEQHSHVEDATSQGIAQVNMITCFMSSMRPDALVNQGNYIALVDKKKCDPNSRSDSSSSDAGSSTPSYMSSVVNSTRASNSDPMRAQIWIDQSEKDFAATIFVNTVATEAPTATNPYGVFRLDYCGKADGVSGCLMNGFLEGSTSGINYFETEMNGGPGGGTATTALRLIASSTDSGSGALNMSQGGQQIAYSFAYNDSYFRRSDGSSDECFSRLADDPDTGMSVWKYGLYDGTSGERVVLHSGFQIDYTNGDGRTFHGQIGYYGLWMPSDAGQIPNGATVQRIEYVPDHEPTKTPYTLTRADGRMTKYTKKTRTLASADKIKFNVFVFDVTGFFAGAEGNKQYEMYWDDAAKAFKATGTMECGDRGCQTKDLPSEQTVQSSFFANMGGVRGWSQSLGGEVFIPVAGTGTLDSTSVNVIYRVQDLVYPSQMPATLYCLRECPTAATMASYFAPGSSDMSPFAPSTFNNWQPTGADGVVAYTSDASNAVLRDGANAAVSFTNADALQSRPQYMNGVRTGRLFTSLADAQCANDPTHYCDNKVDELEVYYQWETGPNQWNQFAAVKDSSGTIVTFDAPLQVTYAVPGDSTHYGAYAGKSLVLQYGGFGDLWGIPGHCVSRLTNENVSCDTNESRYVPAFVIPFDDVLGHVNNGSTTYLAKWLDREIRFARKDPAVCGANGVSLPSSLALPDASGLKNPSDPNSAIYIGEKPVVTTQPRVIDGEVKW
jgi:hypothetical protein